MREKELMAQIDQLQLELSEAEWAREDAEIKLEQVQAKLDEILSQNKNNEKLVPDNENSQLRDALDDVFSANEIVDGELENECSNLKEEVNELKNKLKEIGIDLTQLKEGDYYFSFLTFRCCRSTVGILLSFSELLHTVNFGSEIV